MYLLCLRVGKENKLLSEVSTSYYFKHVVLLKKELDKTLEVVAGFDDARHLTFWSFFT